MSAQKLDITLYDNDTLRIALTLKQGVTVSHANTAALPPLPLTGYHALLQARNPENGDLLGEISTPALQGHVGTGIVIADPANGQLTLTFLPAFTTPSLLLLKIVDYDMVVIDPQGAPYRVMYGKLTTLKGVARV